MKEKRPFIFGEVLFDVYPDGTEKMGGAPFNVAWHLAAFGLDPLFISCIGIDKRGDIVINAMQRWGIDHTAVQRNDNYSTGVVNVTENHSGPSYTIPEAQAFDYIDLNVFKNSVINQDCSLIYHGSLALRNQTNQATLKYILNNYKNYISFIDLNLRDPWWSKETVINFMGGVNWLKLNSNEMKMLSNGIGLTKDLSTLCNKYNIDTVLLTMDKDGALLFNNKKITKITPENIPDFIDAVGAGDAFSAVSILGVLKGWSVNDITIRSVEFASAICRVKGPISHDLSLYKKFTKKWNI